MSGNYHTKVDAGTYEIKAHCTKKQGIHYTKNVVGTSFQYRSMALTLEPNRANSASRNAQLDPKACLVAPMADAILQRRATSPCAYSLSLSTHHSSSPIKRNSAVGHSTCRHPRTCLLAQESLTGNSGTTTFRCDSRLQRDSVVVVEMNKSLFGPR